jgi:hypothetical protein
MQYNHGKLMQSLMLMTLKQMMLLLVKVNFQLNEMVTLGIVDE